MKECQGAARSFARMQLHDQFMRVRAVENFITELHCTRMTGFKRQRRRRIRRKCLVKVLQKVPNDSAQPPRTPQLPRFATSFKRRHCRLQTATIPIVNKHHVAQDRPDLSAASQPRVPGRNVTQTHFGSKACLLLLGAAYVWNMPREKVPGHASRQKTEVNRLNVQRIANRNTNSSRSMGRWRVTNECGCSRGFTVGVLGRARAVEGAAGLKCNNVTTSHSKVTLSIALACRMHMQESSSHPELVPSLHQ